MNAPTVSVCIPVYNTGRYLAECMGSVLAQTWRDLEVVVVDDGSRDDSLEVIKSFAARDPRVTWRTRENRGLIATRNETLEVARGELIAWVDSDDRCRADRIEQQVARFQRESGLVALGSGWRMIDPDGMPIRPFGFPTEHEQIIAQMLAGDTAMCFPTVMMRRDAARQVGGFREPFKIAEDYDICLRLADVGRLGNLPDPLVDYRQHLSSTVNSRRWEAKTYSELANALAHERREKGADRLQRGEAVSLVFEKEVSARDNAFDTQLRWAWWALMAGHLPTARKYARRTLRLAPFSKDSWRIAFCATRGH